MDTKRGGTWNTTMGWSYTRRNAGCLSLRQPGILLCREPAYTILDGRISMWIFYHCARRVEFFGNVYGRQRSAPWWHEFWCTIVDNTSIASHFLDRQRSPAPGWHPGGATLFSSPLDTLVLGAHVMKRRKATSVGSTPRSGLTRCHWGQ